MNFDEAFNLLILNEGGYTDDPKDRGNWTSGKIGVGECKGTNFGISAMSYPNLDIRNLSVTQVRDIYKRDFWDKLQIDTLPENIRFDMFDIAVNSGVSRAIILLQRALNVIDDGVIGPMTKSAIHITEPEDLDSRLNAQRLLFIASLPTFPTYGKGWVIRVAHNLLKD